MEKVIKDLIDVFPLALLAMIGWIVKLIIDGKKITIKKFLTSSFVAGFVGAMTAFLLQPINLPAPVLYFLCGMSGHSAGSVLLIYEKKLEAFLKRIAVK